MTEIFKRGIARATDLTRAGKLHEATGMIQSLLARRSDPQDDAVEGTVTRLGGRQPTPAAKPDRPATRAGLGETLRRIASGGMPVRGPLADAGPVPAGAQFLALTHRSAQGSLDYRLYIPANPATAPMPLIVMLHGCTQTPEDFATGTGMNALAEEFGCLVAYPAQPTGANVQKCWNWFRPEDQTRGAGEPARFAALADEIRANHAVDPTRIYIAGLSAGAAAALVTAAAYPEIFSAVGAHSGLPAGSARDVASAFSAMRSGGQGRPHKTALPTIVFHGTGDATVHPSNATAIIAQAIGAMPALETTFETGRSDGDREFSKTAYVTQAGHPMAELWEIDAAGHAWAGGEPGASYTDPKGPDASRHMLRFFLAQGAA
ncbi:MAG: PHB depolymerase family esterase [Tabrizicola sp.]|uniref:extracellular catalytic domain type 1 short-chain-length polyhydroxyalkanoate depolymerase n=1 Tax=Tabrizicola sp. TaxID=2005166 RepID=UPI002734AFD1|nr:PHB depolymerase family esterase [Tabrizicola sp.]MDP3264734.1 PHB depolymerase family esterase [Tabrizicola sp.]MDP3649929.1 PHB depolymerase family esterase [Paracoccaceae bacterium]MDZ4065237.1 PHB depolymerase family esterase [Tabrizicola sp.]